MNRKEHLLTVASEECNEVAQSISKALRFGLDDHKPGSDTDNSEKIMQEYHDLKAIIKMLQDEGHLPVWSDERSEFQINTKKIQVEKFLNFSKGKGTLQI